MVILIFDESHVPSPKAVKAAKIVIKVIFMEVSNFPPVSCMPIGKVDSVEAPYES